MSTVTAALAAQAVGTGANVGSAKFPFKITKQPGSTVFSVEAMISTGAGAPISRSPILIHVGTNSFSLTTAEAIVRLKNLQQLLVKADADPAVFLNYTTDLIPFKGDYAYLWMDIPNWTVAGALWVWFVELP